MNKNLRIPFVFIILTIGIVLGIQIDKIFSDNNLNESMKKFNEVLTYTEKYYFEEIDSPKLVESAIKGMLNDLDPHSLYIPSEEFTSVEESFRGEFEGIGIEFQVVNDTLTVVSPITGGPSEALGILPGDRIVKIDGKDCVGITNEEVTKKLRGKAGTKVNVSIHRVGTKDLLEYEIVRDKIPINSVDVSLMLDDKTGYISFSRFSENTYDELINVLDDLKQKGMIKLVLDLRGNPGGYLSQAVKIADLFIDGKKKIVYTKGRREEFDSVYTASKSSDYEKTPLIILINHGSASASEIVAGAVQDWDRGLLVGETSFGKGLVQQQFTLPDNSAIRLTTSQYFTPSGRLIQRDYKGKENREEYYSEIQDKNEAEGENIEHNAEKDTLKPVFKTEGGRVVYGGGGITPDYIVKSEDLTNYTRELLRNNIFYLYTLRYLDNNSNKLTSVYGNNLSMFNNEFSFPEEELKNFISFAESKGVKFNEEDFNKEKKYIETRLKAQVARNFWKNEGWYTVMLTVDKQLDKATTLFNEAKELANLK